MTEPTNAEIVRRLDEAARRIESVVDSVQKMNDRADSLYQRKDVQAEINKGTETRVKTLEVENDERDKRAADTRRQFMFLVLAIALPAIGGLLLAVNNFLNAAGR